MKKSLVFPHILLLLLLFCVVVLPGSRTNARQPQAFLAAIGCMELMFLRNIRKGKEKNGACDLMSLIWILLLVWELSTRVWNIAHPVLVPCPENVFDTFREQWQVMLKNVGYSMALLGMGFSLGMILAVALGLAAGWNSRLRAVVEPIANVLSPIPPVVISPYLVAVMPTFRSASVAVVVLGVFFPTCLATIQRVCAMDRQTLDLAKTLEPGILTMIGQILLPYILPGVIAGLKVSLTTGMLMLNFAELMGATHGMGYYVQNAITYANYTHAVAGILVIGMVVTVLNRFVAWVQRTVFLPE